MTSWVRFYLQNEVQIKFNGIKWIMSLVIGMLIRFCLQDCRLVEISGLELQESATLQANVYYLRFNHGNVTEPLNQMLAVREGLRLACSRPGAPPFFTNNFMHFKSI